jgi:ribosomal protein S18 acetylase RimI-like enzyme
LLHPVLEQAAGLSAQALEAIAELEARVVQADGGRLKLEWPTLRRRDGERVEDLLWWDGDWLAGFLGLYRHRAGLELAGMVAPDARGRGIGTALLDAATALCRELGDQQALLIVPRPSAAGKSLALRRGGVLDHSEHALELTRSPTDGPHDPTLAVRPATVAEVPLVSRLLEVGFGHPAPDDLAARLNLAHERTLIIERRGSPIGTMRLNRDGDSAGIYGFVIDQPWQGRGFGRDALRRICAQLRAEGARRIALEVEVQNDRALALYEAVGFTPVITEDYFALPLS